MKTLQILACIACVSFNMMIGSAQPLTLEQVNGNTYLMNLQGKLEQNELTWSTYPDSWKDPIIIEMKKNQDTIKLNSVHPLIHLHTQGESYYFSQRLISLKGGINFRDLGGYVTRDGKQVKWGKIYRSADISKLTDDDLNVISTLHIVLDCDLRGDQEVAAGPDKIPTGVERLYLPAGSENMGMSDYLKYMKTETTADSIMMVFYSKTDHFQKKYKPVFDRLLILGNDEAVLFHCSAGKDRTGIGAALILYALGVDENVIYQDYELTNLYRKKTNDQYIKLLAMQGIPENAAERFMTADPKYLKVTFDALKKQYGSIDAFLTSQMGLDDNNLQKLRKQYLY